MQNPLKDFCKGSHGSEFEINELMLKFYKLQAIEKHSLTSGSKVIFFSVISYVVYFQYPMFEI